MSGIWGISQETKRQHMLSEQIGAKCGQIEYKTDLKKGKKNLGKNCADNKKPAALSN